MTFTAAQLEALDANGYLSFDSLVSAVPGVSSEPLMLGGTSVDGASGLENMYYVDGADTTNIKDGSSGQSVSFDFVDEV